MRRSVLLVVLVLGLVACDDNGIVDNQPTNDCYQGGCQTRDLPLVDGTDAPSLLAVKLECQEDAVVVLATASDPQGSENLQTVLQTISPVHADLRLQRLARARAT